jgi:hypothetical protein
MGERACAFCGSTSGLTREHLWPRWVRGLVGEAPGMTVWASGEHVERARQLPPATVTVRKVCRTCNEGWLHDLEEAARPIMTPLIEGDAASLSVEDQRVIAYWATKTVCVGDLACADDTRCLPSGLLGLLRTASGPWPASVTTAARYRGTRFPLRFARSVDTVTLEAEDAAVSIKTFSGWVSMGHLALQVWYHDLTNVRDFRPGGWKRAHARVIWPDPQPATWPPSEGLNDSELERFMAPG